MELLHVCEPEDSILSQFQFLLNLIYRFYTIPVKVPTGYFVDNDKLITSLYREAKDSELPMHTEEVELN